MTGELNGGAGANGHGFGVGGAVVPVAPPRRSVGALDAETLAELRRRVEETAVSLRVIAAEFGVGHASLARLAAEEDWTRPAGAPRGRGGPRAGERRLAASIGDAGAVMARLLRAVDRQIGKIETRLRKKGATVEEKDARILGHLGRTLATLMTLDSDGGSADKPEPVDRAELNAQLADRIARWAERQRGNS